MPVVRVGLSPGAKVELDPLGQKRTKQHASHRAWKVADTNQTLGSLSELLKGSGGTFPRYSMVEHCIVNSYICSGEGLYDER